MKYFILTNFNLDVDIKGHAILLEDIKRGHSARQIHFTDVPFIIMGTKRLDCAHGVDLCVSSKKKNRKTKLSRWKRLVFVRWCHKIIDKLKNLNYNVIGKSKSSIKGPIFEMNTQTTGRNIDSRLWAIPGVRFTFIWNKTGYYVEQRWKHSGKLSGTKYLKCSITIFLRIYLEQQRPCFP